MKFLRNVWLKKHTSFRIGGPADYFVIPKNLKELNEALKFAEEKNLMVALMGAGTNLLVLDKGFRGLVIKLGGGISYIKVRGRTAWVGAGTYLSSLLQTLMRKGLGGLEFLAGIPGTVGGAVVMNAGAWGREIGKYVKSVRVLEKSGKERVLEGKQLKFGYRTSIFQKGKYLLVEVVFRLRKKRPSFIKRKMQEFLGKRKKSQPLGVPSAGSIFRNPPNGFAGKILEEAGCKGWRVGDAQVSHKHANFIINLGEAKARDVLQLMTKMQKAVKVKLEPELKLMVKWPLSR
jgi:UDP-N-acetylmuramate dehydrogenase